MVRTTDFYGRTVGQVFVVDSDPIFTYLLLYKRLFMN